MNLKFDTGDINWKTYGGSFVTKKLTNGDFDYWIFCNFTNMVEVEENPEFKYMVSLNIVAPFEVSNKDKESAFYTLGLEDKNIEDIGVLEMASILNETGTGARVITIQGNNATEILKNMRAECDVIESLLGFYLDKQMNAIGNTGWDFLKGEIGFKKQEVKE